MKEGDNIVASKAQLRANRRYKLRHKKQTRRDSYKSSCKNYILNWCKSQDELNVVKGWVNKTQEKLNNK